MKEKLVKRLRLKGVRRAVNLYLVNRVFTGKREGFFETKRKLLNKIGYSVGEGTKVIGPFLCQGAVTIGKNCWIGKNFTVNGNGTVIIGDNCDIGPEVTFQTGGHEIGDKERRAGKGVTFTQTVGSGTWIGGRSTILNHVRVGKSCVIAGCSCVVKNVEDNTLVGGVPAKVIRRLTDESKGCFEESNG